MVRSSRWAGAVCGWVVVLGLTLAGTAQANLFQVNVSTGDETVTGSLNWAVAQANATPGGPHSINIDNSLNKITLPFDLPIIAIDLEIHGNGVTIDANGHRGFFVGDGQNSINVFISDVSVDGAVAQGGTGGNGGGGGGGGLGAGAGLFVNQNAHVTIEDVSFQNNSAIGGNGGHGNGAGSPSGGGGGGGFGGAGGSATIDAGAGGGGFSGAGGTAGMGGSGGGGLYGHGGNTDGTQFAGAGGGGLLGSGGSGGVGAGGGGGGALLPGGDGGVVFGGGALTGGNGGDLGGFHGGDGATSGGGGGGGASPASGGNGGNGGLFAGGGGGGQGAVVDAGDGGNGGIFGGGGGGGIGDFAGKGGQGNDFGGGGGSGIGSFSGANAGNGGFGAGGGGVGTTVIGSQGAAGNGGFGAGNGGGQQSGGGGGSAYGSAIFVRNGGSLTYAGGIVNNNSVQGGAGGGGPSGNGANGTAAGSVYLYYNNFVADGNNATIVAGDITGNGDVVKNGSGVLNLEGAQTFSGNTFVHGGTFVLNGTVTNDVTVDAGSVLAGKANINGTVHLDGTISPGNSIGTVNIGGQLNMSPTSTLDIEIDPAGNHDTINVGGKANIDGLVNVQSAPGSYTSGTTYTFLNAGSGINGNFAGVIDDLPFYDVLLLYTPLSVSLQLMQNNANYASIAENYNQWQVGNYLDGLAPGSGDLATVLNQLNLLNTSQARAALQSMDAEIYGSFAQLNVQNLTYQYMLIRRRAGSGLGGGVQSHVGLASNASETQIIFVRDEGGTSRPLFRSTVDSRNCWSTWATGYGIGGNVQTDGNAGGGNYGLGGTIVAMERYLDDTHALGFFGSYTNLSLRIAAPTQSAVGNDGQFGSYLVEDNGTHYWLAAGSLGFNGNSANRQMSIGSIGRTAQSDFSGWQAVAYGEQGSRIFWGRTVFQPFTALQYIYVRQNALTEGGAHSLNLDVRGNDTNALRGLLGTRLARTYQTKAGPLLVPELRAIWLHEFLAPETVLNARFAGISGASFFTRGLNYGRDWAVLGGGFNWVVDTHFSLYANYDLQFNARQAFHVGSGGAQFTW